MAEINLNRAALEAAKETVIKDYGNGGPTELGVGWLGWLTEIAIRAYLSADPDRAARDAVVEAARKYVARSTDHIGQSLDIYYPLHAAVAALPKDPTHD